MLQKQSICYKCVLHWYSFLRNTTESHPIAPRWSQFHFWRDLNPSSLCSRLKLELPRWAPYCPTYSVWITRLIQWYILNSCANWNQRNAPDWAFWRLPWIRGLQLWWFMMMMIHSFRLWQHTINAVIFKFRCSRNCIISVEQKSSTIPWIQLH